MTTLALELSDVGIVAAVDGRIVGVPSPGFAVLDGATVRTGVDAARHRRRTPRHASNGFWRALDQEPVGRPFPAHLTHADLVYRHLADLTGALAGELGGPSELDGRAHQIVLAVPGSIVGERLELLLGVARAAGLDVTGLVDGAVAAASAADDLDGDVVHFDLELHGAVATELVAANGSITRRRVRLDLGAGWTTLEDLWCRWIAGRFVDLTRFDPLHTAATDQILHDRLPGWLGQLKTSAELTLNLEHGGEPASITLQRADLVAVAAPIYHRWIELIRHALHPASPTTVLLSSRAAALPGLAQALTTLADVRVITLPAGAAATAASRLTAPTFGVSSAARPGDADAELPLITQLPMAQLPMAPLPTAQRELRPNRDAPAAVALGPVPATQPSTTQPKATRPVPTHVVHAGLAYPIAAAPLTIGVAPTGAQVIALSGATAGISRAHCQLHRNGDAVVVEDHSRHGTFLNDRRIDGSATVAAGDRLRLGAPGIELVLIAVVSEAPTGSTSERDEAGKSATDRPPRHTWRT